MIVFDDAFSQYAVAQTLRAPSNQYVRDQMLTWMSANAYPTECITPESERSEIEFADWQWVRIVRPENPVMFRVRLSVCRADVDDDGLAKEISFSWQHNRCDKYGRPTEWVDGGVFCTYGILFNHGSVTEPQWSVHT